MERGLTTATMDRYQRFVRRFLIERFGEGPLLLNDLWASDHCCMARDQGVLISINSDSHSRKMLGYQEYGLFTARRGWLEAKDVINTYPLEKLQKVLKKEEYPAGDRRPEAGNSKS